MCKELKDWQQQREATIKSLEEVANEINTLYKDVNEILLTDYMTSLASDVCSLIINIFSSVEEDIERHSLLKAITNIGTATASPLANKIKKKKVSKLLDKAQVALQDERESHKIVIDKLMFKQHDADIMKLEATNPEEPFTMKIRCQIGIGIARLYYTLPTAREWSVFFRMVIPIIQELVKMILHKLDANEDVCADIEDILDVVKEIAGSEISQPLTETIAVCEAFFKSMDSFVQESEQEIQVREKINALKKEATDITVAFWYGNTNT